MIKKFEEYKMNEGFIQTSIKKDTQSTLNDVSEWHSLLRNLAKDKEITLEQFDDLNINLDIIIENMHQFKDKLDKI